MYPSIWLIRRKIFIFPNISPVPNTASASRKWNRAPSPSTLLRVPARIVRDLARNWRSTLSASFRIRDRSLNEGAIASMEWSGPKEEGGYYWQGLQAAAKAYRIDLDKPVSELTKEQLDIVLYGTGDRQVQMTYRNPTEMRFKILARLRRRDHKPGAALSGDQLRIYSREDLASSCPTVPVPPVRAKD